MVFILPQASNTRKLSSKDKSIPRVSVITVCLNAVDTIDGTIQSVLSQTYSQIEYIVVDGASTDGTLERLHSYDAAITKLISEPDTGLYNAMNKALDLVEGDIVVFMNAGDMFTSANVVEQMAAVFRKHPEVMIAYGDYIARYTDRDVPIKQPGQLNKWQLWLRAVCHQTVFARREAFEQAGKFDESLDICADWDWLLRCVVLHSMPTHHVPLDVCIFQMGGFCSNRSVMEQNKRVMRQRYYSFHERIIFSTAELLLKIWRRLSARDFSLPWRLRHFLSDNNLR